MGDIPDVDLSKVGTTKFGSFEVEVVDYTAEYFATLKVRAALAGDRRQAAARGTVTAAAAAAVLSAQPAGSRVHAIAR